MTTIRPAVESDTATIEALLAPEILRGSLRQAWLARWWALLSIAAQDALAASLSETALGALEGGGGPEPSLGDLLLDAVP